MRVNKKYNYSNPYSSNINNKMKAKRVGKKNAKTRLHHDVLSKRKSKNSTKNLSIALQVVIDPLENKVGVHE